MKNICENSRITRKRQKSGAAQGRPRFSGLCAVLLQQAEFAHNRQFLGTSVGSIDDADDKKDEADNAGNRSQQAPDPSQETTDHTADQQDQALIGVVACKGGILPCDNGDQHQDPEICQDRHALVGFHIVDVKGAGGVRRIIKLGNLVAEVGSSRGRCRSAASTGARR